MRKLVAVGVVGAAVASMAMSIAHSGSIAERVEYRPSSELVLGAWGSEWGGSEGWLIAQPIIYEDFLPVSAAGIFQSNLGSDGGHRQHGHSSRSEFETALGAAVADEFSLYQQAEDRSKRRCGLL